MKGYEVAKRRISVIILCFLGFLFLLASCAATNRAVVHQDDLKMVFPWPKDRKSVEIRVKPKVTLESTGSVFSSFQKVMVTPDTTFFLTDAMGQESAYRPVHMPLRRIIRIKSIEIRWPQKKPASVEKNGSEPEQ